MLFRLHFKCRFWLCFLDFWRQFGAPFGIISQKKTLPKIPSKKGAPNMKTTTYEHVRRLPERPPRVRTSQTRNNSSSTNFKHCCSSSCSVLENAVLICFNCIFTKMFEKMKRVDVKNTLLVIWHAQSAKGLANFSPAMMFAQTNECIAFLDFVVQIPLTMLSMRWDQPRSERQW